MSSTTPVYLTPEDLIARWDPKDLADLLGDPAADATLGSGATMTRLRLIILDAARVLAPLVRKLQTNGFPVTRIDEYLVYANLVGANYHLHKYKGYVDRGPQDTRINPWFGEWQHVIEVLDTGSGLNLYLDEVETNPGGLLNTTADEPFRVRRHADDGRGSGIDLSQEF